MSDSFIAPNRRILLIDDNSDIHEDFRKILNPRLRSSTDLSESLSAFLGEAADRGSRPVFEIDSAFQGAEAVTRVREACSQHRPYAMAFVDVRMPPGLDGIDTIVRIWGLDPDVQIVVCTAYSDYSWEEVLQKLGRRDGLIILKKPFDMVEVLQLAEALTERWRAGLQARVRLEDLERMVSERTAALTVLNEKLQAANHDLVEATERANATIRAAAASQVALEEILQSLARNDPAGVGDAFRALKEASVHLEVSAATVK